VPRSRFPHTTLIYHDGVWWIQVRITDDGPGIPADDLPHVFERLYVAQHRPTGRESGSGLGLAIVRELVDAMDGEVEAVAPADGGTEMVVRIPSVSEE
jgi:two-component system sensor histidine kinase BaeS